MTDTPTIIPAAPACDVLAPDVAGTYEPVLSLPPSRPGVYVTFGDVLYKKIEEAANLHDSIAWSANEIDESKDAASLASAPGGCRDILRRLFSVFLTCDKLVAGHLSGAIANAVTRPELLDFLSIQERMEFVHLKTYDKLARAIFSGEDLDCIRAIDTRNAHHVPASVRILEWVERNLDSTSSIAKRIALYVCVEGIVFPLTFVIVYWLRTLGVCPGLCKGNEFIARDEGIHANTWAYVYTRLRNKLPPATLRALVEDAIEQATRIAADILGEHAGSLAPSLAALREYAEVMANNTLASMGDHTPVRPGAVCTLGFMNELCIPGVTDFFNEPVSEYDARVPGATYKKDLFQDTD